MLKGIPPIISPLMLKTLSEMGHGDTLVIADGNFPAESVGKDAVVIRCDGHGVPELLRAIVTLLPLDTYVDQPVTLMDVVEGDDVDTPIWREYESIVAGVDLRGAEAIGKLERFDFYDRARGAYCIIATSERAQYANVILRKGVVFPGE